MWPHEYIVEDVKPGNNEWRICRMKDHHYSVEEFSSKIEALNALALGEYVIWEG